MTNFKIPVTNFLNSDDKLFNSDDKLVNVGDNVNSDDDNNDAFSGEEKHEDGGGSEQLQIVHKGEQIMQKNNLYPQVDRKIFYIQIFRYFNIFIICI